MVEAQLVKDRVTILIEEGGFQGQGSLSLQHVPYLAARALALSLHTFLPSSFLDI